MASRELMIPVGRIEKRIRIVRGCRIMLDMDLAELYGVETKALNRAVRRNIVRFPEDFAFQLTPKEFEDLRCQSGTSNLRSRMVTSKRGGRRYLPFAFTEQGVAMLSSVLHSKRAIHVNIEVMRAFVRLKHYLASHADLVRKVKELERRYDGHFLVVFKAIEELLEEREEPPKSRIGFHAK